MEKRTKNIVRVTSRERETCTAGAARNKRIEFSGTKKLLMGYSVM